MMLGSGKSSKEEEKRTQKILTEGFSDTGFSRMLAFLRGGEGRAEGISAGNDGWDTDVTGSGTIELEGICIDENGIMTTKQDSSTSCKGDSGKIPQKGANDMPRRCDVKIATPIEIGHGEEPLQLRVVMDEWWVKPRYVFTQAQQARIQKESRKGPAAQAALMFQFEVEGAMHPQHPETKRKNMWLSIATEKEKVREREKERGKDLVKERKTEEEKRRLETVLVNNMNQGTMLGEDGSYYYVDRGLFRRI
jgi:hypothetical protein